MYIAEDFPRTSRDFLETFADMHLPNATALPVRSFCFSLGVRTCMFITGEVEHSQGSAGLHAAYTLIVLYNDQHQTHAISTGFRVRCADLHSRQSAARPVTDTTIMCMSEEGGSNHVGGSLPSCCCHRAVPTSATTCLPLRLSFGSPPCSWEKAAVQ